MAAKDKMVRIDIRVHRLMRLLAKKNNRPMAWEINAILIAHLKKHGLWKE